MKTLENAKAQIIVPTPALSEVLIGAADDSAHQYLEILNKSSRFRLAPFGERAALEAAASHREAITAGDKKEGAASWSNIRSRSSDYRRCAASPLGRPWRHCRGYRET
jgi:predicted nucleic acid-binding protein